MTSSFLYRSGQKSSLGHLLLSEAVVEEGEDLLEPLRAELLHPLQVVVGQRHPQRLDARVLLLRAQVRVALKKKTSQ